MQENANPVDSRGVRDRATDALVRWDSQNADPELLTGPLAMRPGPDELAGLLRELLAATAQGGAAGDGDEGPRIEKFEQLAALPVGAVIFDLDNGQAAQREMDGGWYYTGDGNGYQIVQLPAILLRNPVAPESNGAR